RSNNLQIRCQSLKSHIETDLVISLTGTSVRYSLGLMFAGGIDHELSDKWPAQRRGQRILSFINGTRHQSRKHEPVNKHIPGVDGHRVDGTGFEGFLANALDVFALAKIGREGNNV